jgi:tetratricopeptide (TPR) repeat protein
MQQQQLSPKAQAVQSLLEDIDRAENQMSKELEIPLTHQLLQGDLAAAKRGAEQLSGEERNIMLGKCYFWEGRLYYVHLSKGSTENLKNARTALENSLKHAVTPASYRILASIHKELGNHDDARRVLEKAKSSTDPEVRAEGEKELLRLESEMVQKKANTDKVQQEQSGERTVYLGCMGIVAVLGLISLASSPIFLLLLVPIFLLALWQYLTSFVK